MSEKDAEKVWNLICASFALSNVAEAAPDPDESEALAARLALHSVNCFR